MTNKIKTINIYRQPVQAESSGNSVSDSKLEKYLVNSIEYHPEWQKVLCDIQYDPSGHKEQETEYDYDSQGFLISEILKEGDGEVVERKTYEPDEQMRIKKEYRHYADGSFDVVEYVYDSSGQLVQKILSDDEGELEQTVSFEYENGRIVRELTLDAYNEKELEIEYVYDEEGLLDEKITLDHSEGEKRVQSYSYNEDGYRDGILTYDGQGELIERYLFAVDQKGRPITIVEENRQKKNSIKMEYDEKDHIIFQEEYDLNGNLLSRLRRHYNEDGLLLKSHVTSRHPLSGVNQQYEVIHQYDFFENK